MRRGRRRGRIGGLRGQLLAGLFLFLALALSLVALATFQLHKRHLQQSLAQEARRSAAWLAEIDDGLRSQATTALRNRQGVLFAGSSSETPVDLPDFDDVVIHPAEGYPAIWARSAEGQVVVALSLSDAQHAMDMARLAILLYLGLTLIFVALVGYAYFSFVVVRPLRALDVATSRAAEGDLASPIQLLPRNEFGAVGRQFNAMLERLHAQRSELREQLQALQNTLDELTATQNSLIRSEKLAGVGQLAAGLAHEVGNPLAAVMGYTDLLRDRSLDEETVNDVVDRSLAQLQRIRSIIGQLLDYSRVEPQTEPSPVDLAALIQDAIHLVKAGASAQEVGFHLELDDDLPAAKAIGGELSQVLVNLLLNGMDAMADSTDSSQTDASPNTLRIRATSDDHHLFIDIVDSGPGIAAEHRQRIFDPFFTTKNPGEGTGLGLAISQRLVARSQGTLTLLPSPRGAHFRIALPRAES